MEIKCENNFHQRYLEVSLGRTMRAFVFEHLIDRDLFKESVKGVDALFIEGGTDEPLPICPIESVGATFFLIIWNRFTSKAWRLKIGFLPPFKRLC